MKQWSKKPRLVLELASKQEAQRFETYSPRDKDQVVRDLSSQEGIQTTNSSMVFCLLSFVLVEYDSWDRLSWLTTAPTVDGSNSRLARVLTEDCSFVSKWLTDCVRSLGLTIFWQSYRSILSFIDICAVCNSIFRLDTYSHNNTYTEFWQSPQIHTYLIFVLRWRIKYT